MPRRKRDYLQNTHVRLQSWAVWVITYVDNAGYPHETIEARLMAGGAESRPPPGPRVPNVMMPDEIGEVDRGLRTMPEQLSAAVRRYYLDGQHIPRRTLSEALHWLSGRLTGIME
jgi:hypothetical protein